MKRKYVRYSLCVLLILLFILSLFIGALDLSIEGLLKGNDSMIHVLLYSRLPRTLSIVLSASSLAISGLIMQKISTNRFVSPQTAITQDATKLGLLIAMLLNFNFLGRTIVAIVISFIASLGFFKFINSIRNLDPITIPIIGIILGSVIDAFTSLIAQRTDMVQPLNAILSKGFISVFKGGYEILFINLILLLIAYKYINRFILVSMGHSTASNLGVDVKKIVNIGLVLICIMSAIVMISVGNIPFVGLLIPNLVSVLFDDSGDGLFLDTVLMSTCYLLLCDCLARIVIQPYEVPISLISGVIGATIFIWVLLRRTYEEK